MSVAAIKNWQAVQEEVLRRINTRIWKPGDMIPNEADLASEFGCARATVNRALRALSEDGLLERRRKAGTRVAIHPVRKATLDISMIRKEIEDQNKAYSYKLLFNEISNAPVSVKSRMNLNSIDKVLQVKSVHMANGTPYVYENRWINLTSLPDAMETSFEKISANEWLLIHAPYTHGEISFSAANCGEKEASILDCESGSAIFVINRLTWNNEMAVTMVKQWFAPGYNMYTSL